MNQGWMIKKIGEIYDVRDGTHDSPKYQDEGFPLITSKNLKNGKLSFEKIKFISAHDFESINRRSKVDIGDVLFAMIGTIGNPVVITEEPNFSIKNVALFKVSSDQSSEYLKYYLDSSYVIQKMFKEAKGTTQKFVGLGYLRNFEIPIPSLREQKQIVAILDQAFAAIDQAQANIQKNIQNAQDLFQSKLNQIFSQQGEGWEEKTLQEVSVEFGRGKSKHRPRNEPSLFGGEYPFIQTGDVRNSDHYITQYSSTYNEKGLQQSKLWPKGTVCITIAANIAETGILSFAGCFPDSIIGIVVNDKITTSNYVEFLLQAMKVRIQAKGKGSAQANINLGTFQKEMFPFPSLIEQEKIMSELTSLSNTISDLEKRYQQKINEIEELKKSLLQKAFNGELAQDKQAA